MRPKVVVPLAPPIKAALLGLRIHGGRPGGPILEHAVHLFVRGIVLGATRPAVFEAEAKFDPRGAQARPPPRAERAKGPAVVQAQRPGQSVTAEQGQHHRSDLPITSPADVAHAKHVAARQIPDGQCVDALPVAGAEATFQIDRPHVVDPAPHQPAGDPDHRAGRSPPLAPAHLARSLQPSCERTHRRRSLVGIVAPQPPAQLLRAKVRRLPLHQLQSLRPALTQLLRRLWPAGSDLQSLAALGLKTPPPLVTALPTDPVPATQRRHALTAFTRQPLRYELLSRFNLIVNFPGHMRPSNCQRCLLLKVSAMCEIMPLLRP